VAGCIPSAVSNTNPKVAKATIANLCIFFSEPENSDDYYYLLLPRFSRSSINLTFWILLAWLDIRTLAVYAARWGVRNVGYRGTGM
jgi:hypothetical protein